MVGFMITTDYETQVTFRRPVVVLDMYDDTETILNKICKKSDEIVTNCDKDHPLLICLHLGAKWSSYKTVQRLYVVLSLFKDSIKDSHNVDVVIDFTAESAITLTKFGELEDFRSLSATSIEVKEG